ncbi:MAG: CHAT domain-containing protein [Acidobacteriota bacterium]
MNGRQPASTVVLSRLRRTVWFCPLAIFITGLLACQKPPPTDLASVWQELGQWPVTSPHGFRLSGTPAPSTGTIARLDLAQVARLATAIATATTLDSTQRTQALVWHDLSAGEIHLARRRLTAPHPATADWFNEVGVVQAEWALRYGRPEDFEAALKAFLRSLETSAQAQAAHFNRALLFQQLGLAHRAEAEWRSYLAEEPDPAWAAVARQHLDSLTQQPPDRSHLRETLAGLTDTPETTEAQEFFIHHLGTLLDEAGTLAENFVTSGEIQHLKQLQCLAQQSKQRAGDLWVADLTEAIAKLRNTEQAAQWLKARHELRRARQLYPIEGKPTAAEPLYERAHQTFLTVGDLASAAEAELGLVYCAVQRPEISQLDHYSAALLSTARARHYARLEGQTLRVRAQLTLRQARPALAITYCQSALAIFQKLSDWEETQRTLLILSDAYEHQGNAAAALSALRQLLQMGSRRGSNPRRHSQACTFSARTCAAAGAIELGLSFAEEARIAATGQTFPAFQLDAETLLAVLSVKAGRVAAATAALDRAAQVLERVGDPRVRQVLALDYLPTAAWCRMAIGEPVAALQLCTAAEKNLRTGQHDAYWPLVASVQSAAHLALGNPQLAKAALEAGIRWLETTRLHLAQTPDRQRFFHRHAELYERLATLHLQHDQVMEAFACLERARARTFLDRRQVPEHSGGVSPLLPITRRAFTRALQARLPESVIVLAYAVGDKQTESFVLTRRDLRHATLAIASEQLAQNIHALSRSLADAMSDIAYIRQIGQQLYATLVAPLRLSWTASTRLVIIPDGPLYSLPWAALCDAEGQWFGQQVPSSICPSVGMLIQALEKDAQPIQELQAGEVLVAADPDLTATAEAQDLVPLSGARDEVFCVQSLLKPAVTLTGDQVTKQRLLAALHTAKMAHLAVHGRAEPEAPLQSVLYLAAGPEDDGRLTATEVYACSFPQLRLVVLSACESAVGAPLRGEGATGLGQAFLAAGAASVVATLSRTDDRFMRNLMCAFYTARQAGASPGVALQQAWQSVPNHHPAQWANVILLGAP